MAWGSALAAGTRSSRSGPKRSPKSGPRAWAETAWAERAWAETAWAETAWAERAWAEMAWAEGLEGLRAWAETAWAEMAWAEMAWAEIAWRALSGLKHSSERLPSASRSRPRRHSLMPLAPFPPPSPSALLEDDIARGWRRTCKGGIAHARVERAGVTITTTAAPLGAGEGAAH